MSYTDAEVERLAIHMLNEYRERWQSHYLDEVSSLDELSEFAREDWRSKAKTLLDAAFGS